MLLPTPENVGPLRVLGPGVRKERDAVVTVEFPAATFILRRFIGSVAGTVEFSGATVVMRRTTGGVREGGVIPRVLPTLVTLGVFKDIVGVELKPLSN